MNQFFGCDVLSRKKKVSDMRSKKKSQARRFDPKKEDPLQKRIFGRKDLNEFEQSQGFGADTRDTEVEKMSLYDIVQMHQQKPSSPYSDDDDFKRGEQSDQKKVVFAKTFEVVDPNPYAEASEPKMVQIAILDVLFDNQVCNLVYMQDLTEIAKKNNKEKGQESLQMVNKSIADNIQVPQQTIIMLTQQLLESCNEA